MLNAVPHCLDILRDEFSEDVACTAYGGEYQHGSYEYHTLRTGWLVGNGGTLQDGEGGCALLYLGFACLQLGIHGRIGAQAHAHLILQFVPFGYGSLQNDVAMLVAVTAICFCGCIVACLGLIGQLLVVVKVSSGFAGPIVCDELLQSA